MDQADDVGFGAHIMDSALIYRLWQAPFAHKKLAPLLAHNDLRGVRRVLDVGCGPGTNTGYFVTADYLGIDFNQAYVQSARHRYRRNFLVADATTYRAAPGEYFDFILVNSLLHHVDSSSTRRILSHLETLLTQDGHVHILELALPVAPSIARLLARLDRGKFARPVEEWRDIFASIFQPVVFEPYSLTGFGATLWNMIYFKGRSRRAPNQSVSRY